MITCLSPQKMPLSDIQNKVIEESLSWVGTPYIKGSHLKGCGCDCCTLLIEVFVASGLILRGEIDEEMTKLGVYAHDWYLHAQEEKYLRRVMKFATNVMDSRCYPSTKAEPGTIVLTKAFGLSKRWNHGGIVISWPKIVHAVDPKVCITDVTKDAMWFMHEIKIFSVGNPNVR